MVIAGHAAYPIRPTCPDQMFKGMLLGGELTRQGIQIDRRSHATYLVSKSVMRQGDNHSWTLLHHGSSFPMRIVGRSPPAILYANSSPRRNAPKSRNGRVGGDAPTE